MTHKAQSRANHAGKMVQCNMTAQTMTHDDPRPKGKKLRGGGGRAGGKGPTKTYGP